MLSDLNCLVLMSNLCYNFNKDGSMKRRTKRIIKRVITRLFILIIFVVASIYGIKYLLGSKKDDVAPVIISSDRLEYTIGQNIDVYSNASASDDIDGDIKLSVEGKYDITKVGEYKLKYVAKDKAGNVSKKDFILVIKDKEVKNDNTKRTSKGYEIIEKDGVTYINGLLVVNKSYSLPKSFNPGKLDSNVENAAEKMMSAAKESGYNMWVQSGFRSYDTQNNLYNRYVLRDGKNEADKYSARAGHSEHQSGLAFDVCAKNKPCISNDFDDTVEAKWLNDNCYKYGFILRFVKGKEDETGYQHESWHFRYVGEELAKELYNNGDWITLEDYLGITSEYSE